MSDRIDSARPSADPGNRGAASNTNGGMAVAEKGNGNWYGKKRVILPLLFLILLGVAVTYYWYTDIRGYDSTDDAYIDSNDVTISSKTLGRIAFLGTDEGDTVAQGDTLVKLDVSDLKAQEAQAVASIESAQRNAELSNVNLEKTRDDLNRASIQLKGNAITQEQYDHARQALQTAQAQYNLAQAQINTSKAQLNVIQTQLNNSSILAPFGGVVARKWVMPGDVVQAAQPIFTIFDQSDIWVTAMFEETKISSIQIGDPVKITVDAYPDKDFEGKVILTGAAAASQFSLIPPNNASGNFTKVTQRLPVRISISEKNQPKGDPGAQLKAGMSVEVKVQIGEK
jgi:membrane fusion protein, multidrug efflux system